MTNTVQGRVVGITRHGRTVYGNPMLSVTLRLTNGEEHTYRISDNATLSLRIDNPEHRERDMTYRLTRAGRLSGYFTE